MAMVSKFGLMDLNTKESGRMIKPTDTESLYTQTEISTRVNGRMTRLTAMEATHTPMEQLMLENGKTINNTERVLKLGQMVQNTKGNTSKERNTAKAL